MMVHRRYKIDDDNAGTKEGCAPRRLTDEERHNFYSEAVAMDHYKKSVYYRQRKGGFKWFHGRNSDSFRDNYVQIDWNAK